MFSSNLQRNILQLDRRISVLENECFNMELDKKKKKMMNYNNNKDISAPIRLKQSNSKSSDVSVKSSSSSKNITKICVEGNNKIKKFSPSVRVRSTRSAPFSGGKPSNLNNGMSMVENKANLCENQNKKSSATHQCHCTPHSRALILCDGPRGNSCGNGCCSSNNCNGEIKSMSSNKCSGDAEKDSVIHKEVFYTNQNGSIEVTVKQKSNLRNQQEREFLNEVPVKEIKNTETECCKCQCYKKKSLGQKWSDILSLDCGCHSEESRKAVPKNILNSVDLISTSESQDRRHHKPPASDSNVSYKFDRFKMGKRNRETDRDHDHEQNRGEESSGKSGIEGRNDGRKNPLVGSSPADPEKPTETLGNSLRQPGIADPRSDIFATIQTLCDNLIKEKDALTREVATKNSIIERMKKREEDFVSLIDSLKMSLNKIKCGAKANLDAENELKIAKDKLSEQGKVIDSLRRGQIRLKEMLAKSTLEKDRLQTEIQIHKLESQKHDVLMAGKEAEIKRYKQEIGNFQRQISEHLACLKSNSQILDLRKMMEAIIHQSRIFGRDDMDAVSADLPANDGSKGHNGLMHSSPTSTKASDVNSSWREISSIKTQDAAKHRAEDVQDAGDKEFFQVYGGEGSISRHHSRVLPKKSQDSIAFTSCLSATAKEEEKDEPGEQAWTAVASDNARNGIDQLLQGMKLKWSEEVYKVSTSGNDTIEDFLNGTLVSSVCD